MKSFINKFKGIAIFAISAFISTSSFAQVSIEEIIVTGLKRDASILDAPVAVTVFSADQIEKAGITRPEDYLALVPNVGFVTSNHQGEFFVNMRGMATVRFAEAAVAVVVDGIQLAINNEFNMDYFDIEQLEVLKGPQGALYGRNATAGAIIVKTRDPGDEWNGTMMASYGNWHSSKIQGGVGGPINDKFKMRLSASMTNSNGPFTNEYTNEKVHRWANNSGRIHLLYEDENTRVDWRASGSKGNGGAIAFNAQIAGTVTGGYPVIVDTNDVHNIPYVNDMPGENRQYKFSTSLKITHETEDLKFESMTSFSDIRDYYQAKGLPYADYSNPDNDYGVFEFVFGDTTQQWRDSNQAAIQEFRLSSNVDSRLQWQIGAFFMKGTKQRVNTNGLYTGATALPCYFNGPCGGPNSSNPTLNYDNTQFGYENYSPFGNIQYEVSDALDITLAVRYETEKREVETMPQSNVPDLVNGAPTYNQCVLRTGRAPADCNDDATFKQFQPKVTVAYKFPDDAGQIFASYGKGFKSGGFNTIGVRQILLDAAVAAGGNPNLIFTQDSYDKETSDAFELGFKSRFLDGRLQINGAVFMTDVKDAQQFEFFPVGSIQAVSRIDEQEIKGFEADMQFAVNDSFSIFAAYGYVDHEITELQAQPLFVGNKIAYIQDWNATAGYQVNHPISSNLDLVHRLEYKGMGPVWYDSGNLAGSRRDTVNLIDARIGIQSDNYSLMLWGRNLGNEKYASESVPLLSIVNVPHKAATRSYGIEARYNF